MRRTRRGFTLLELAVALGCMTVLASAATILFSTYIAIIKKSKVESVLLRRSQALLEYVVNESRRVGGQGAPALPSVFVENDCRARAGFPDCDHTDRLTFAQPLAGYGTCKVQLDRGGHIIDVKKIRSTLTGPQQCCFQAAVFGRQVEFVKGGVVTPAFLTRTGGGDCRFRFRPIVQDATGSLDDAVIIIADVKTFYLEPPQNDHVLGKLVMHMDLDGDESIVGERLYLSNGVADFQARVSNTGMLGLSIVAGEPLDSGTQDIATAFSTSRHLTLKAQVREATATLAIRDLR